MAKEDWNLGAMVMVDGDDDVGDEDYSDYEDLDVPHGLTRGRGVMARSRDRLMSTTGRVIADLFRVLAPSAQPGSRLPSRPSTSATSSSACCTTERELMRLLSGLRDEGLAPTVLRSKDVYGYSSDATTDHTPPPSIAAPSSPSAVSSSSLTSTGSLDPGGHRCSAPPRRRRPPPTPGANIGKRRKPLKALVKRGDAVSLLKSEPEAGRRPRDRPPGCLTAAAGIQSAEKDRMDLAKRRDRSDEVWRSVSVTVRDSSSDEGVAMARLEAQHQLRVNLSPVIRLQPLPVSGDGSAPGVRHVTPTVQGNAKPNGRRHCSKKCGTVKK